MEILTNNSFNNLCEYIYGIIYIFISPSNGIYIGQTIKSLDERKQQHINDTIRGSNKIFHNAIRKYGINTFTSNILAIAYSKDELNELEKYYITQNNSYYLNKDGSKNEKGYNMTIGGEGANGYVFTEEDRIKLSNSLKEYYQKNPDKCQEMSERAKEYARKNPEKSAQHSEFMKERLKDEEVKRMAIQPLKTFYENNPNAYSEIQKKRYENPEERNKASERAKTYLKENPNALIERSQKMKEFAINNPEQMAQHSEFMKQISNEPEKKEEFKQRMKNDREKNPKKYEKANEKRKATMNTPECKAKMSESKSKKLSPFEVFKNDQKIGGPFTSVPECMKFLTDTYGITKAPSIKKCLNNELLASSGFIFKYIIFC